MTTFVLEGGSWAVDEFGTAIDWQSSTLTFVVSDDFLLTYTVEAGTATDDWPEAIALAPSPGDLYGLALDGSDLGSGWSLRAVRMTFRETSFTDFLVLTSATDDRSHVFRIGGDQRAALTSTGDLSKLANVTSITSIPDGPVAPLVDIDLSTLPEKTKTQDDVIAGTTGAETLKGGAGDDSILGLDGDDRLVGGNGDDTLDGGAGQDTLRGEGGADVLTDFDGPGLLVGGGGNDALRSGDGADTLNAGGGHDTANAGLGADSIDMGGGNDLVEGTGEDTVSLGAGDDTYLLLGGFSALAGDTVNGDSGADSLDAGLALTGVDLSGDGGVDTLIGGAAGDLLSGGDGADSIIAGDGDDTVDGGTGRDDVDLGEGDNRFADGTDKGVGASDTIVAGGGHDTILSRNGDDSIDAGDGDNSITSGTGADWILTGAGNDTVGAGGGHDTINTGLGADQVNAGGGSDLVEGTGEDDVILGAGNDSYLLLGAFAALAGDTVSGGSGADSIDAGVALTAVDLSGGTGADTLVGGAADDRLAGDDGADSILAGGGNDTVDGGKGRDHVDLGEGDNRFSDGTDKGVGASDTIIAGAGNDTIIARAGDDWIDAGDGDNSVNGSAGNDTIMVGHGRDTVVGGSGRDEITILGGTGNEVNAGGGADTLVVVGGTSTIALGSGGDVVRLAFASTATVETQVLTDFTVGADAIDLSPLAAITGQWDGIVNPFGTFLRLVQDGADTLLLADFDGDASFGTTLLRIEDRAAQRFSADNFGGFAVLSPPEAEDDYLNGTYYDWSTRSGPTGSELVVKSAAESAPEAPLLTTLGDDGTYLVAWLNYWDHSGLRATIYDRDGKQTVPEFTIGPITWDGADVASLADGTFAVVTTRSGFGMDGLYLEIYDTSGQIVRFAPDPDAPGVETTLLRVADIPSGNVQSPSVTLLDNGFVVAWKEYDDTAGHRVAKAQQFTKDAVLKGDIRTLSDTPVGGDLSISALDTGGFAAFWERWDGDGRQIVGRFIKAHGNPLTDEFIVSDVADGAASELAVTTLAGGNILVAWESEETHSYVANGLTYGWHGTVIRGRAYAPDGTPTTDVLALSSLDFENGGTTRWDPAIAALDTGGYVVAWMADDGKIVMRLFEAVGTYATPEIVVNETGSWSSSNTVQDLQITALNGGRFVVAWENSGGPNAGLTQRLFHASDALGTAVPLNMALTNDQTVQDIFYTQLIGNDVDPDGGAVEIVAVSATSALGATVTLSEFGTNVFYDPTSSAVLAALANGATLEDSFTYTIEDADGGQSSATVTFKVVGEGNAAPLAQDDMLEHIFANEFAVSDPALETTRNMRTVDTAELAGGNIATLVYSTSLTGYASQVQLRILDADGAEVLAPTLVHDTTDAFYWNPALAALPNGNMVVAWEGDDDTTSVSSRGIFVRIFGPDGTVLGSEILAATPISGSQTNPDVIALAGGNFVVSWLSADDAGNSQLSAAIFTSGGSLVRNHSAISFSSTDTVWPAEIAALTGGGYVAAYVSRDDTSTEITARVYDAMGNFAVSEIPIASGPNVGTTLQQADVAALAGGGFIVTWTEDDTAFDPDGLGIKARIFDAAGVETVPAFAINQLTGSAQTNASVVGLAGGGFAVAWVTYGNEGDVSASAIAARVFAADGTALGDEVLVNQTTAGYQSTPTISALADGGFMVGWIDREDNVYQSDGGIAMARRYQADGTPFEAGYTDELTPISIAAEDVLGNDSDADGEALSLVAVEVTSASGATVTLDGTTVIYDPTGSTVIAALGAGELLTDSFTYTVADETGATATATVSLVVEGVNQAPVGADDDLSSDGTPLTDQQTPVTIETATLLANDSDPEGQVLSLFSLAATSAEGATLSVDDAGNVQYDPTTSTAIAALGVGETLVDSFAYTVSDGAGEVDTATVSLSVESANRNAPIAADDSFAGVAYADSILTNAYTTSNQDGASVVELEGGNLLVAWRSREESGGSLTDVRAQIVTPAGETLVSDLVLADVTTGNQQEIDLVALSGGGFMATWSSRIDPFDATDMEVKARIFDAAGTPTSGEFLVNEETTDLQYLSGVTQLASGVIAVTWMTDFVTGFSEGSNIKMRLFNPDGTAVTGELFVNDTTDYVQSQPAITALDTGLFVVTYSSNDGIDDSSGFGIRARMFRDDGTAFTTSDPVNQQMANGQTDAAVAALDGGGFVITWVSEDGVDDTDASGIKARIFSPLGVETVSEFLVNGGTSGYQQRPSVTVLESGNLVFAWESVNLTTYASTSYVRVFAADGTALGGDIALDPLQSQGQIAPDITALASGGFAVSWGTRNSDFTSDVYTRFFNADGSAAAAGYTDEDTAVTLDGAALLANDVEPDGDTLVILSVDAVSAQGAAVSLTPEGDVLYDPTGSAALQALASGAVVDDSFVYTVSDGLGGYDTATVTIAVAGLDELGL
ncbi:Ig-like domain-containing protein [Mesobacterium pallidum]|uniref:Ig-like domain-containing protein n=1 Tax=Mesobacterium pallidum TaxID=2872037 RepID=UPI001EE329B4|nr:tandem-95 repeat protein [Mesobacterium pallidum]